MERVVLVEMVVLVVLGFLHLIPLCHCGISAMYCRLRCRGNNCKVRKSFFFPPHLYPNHLSPPLSPPLSPLQSFFSLFVLYPCQIYFFSLPLLPLSLTCTDMVFGVLGGECSGMCFHTHIHSARCCCSSPGNNESQKETILQEDLELWLRK